MTLPTVCILLFAVGIVLIVLELALPTQAILGVMGGVAIVGAIGVAFFIQRWLGVGLLVGTVIASPFVATLAMNLWPRTPVGRRVFLPPVESNVVPPRVGLGQTGIAVSELRPMGWVDFADERHEVRSEINIIRPGTRVKVVSIDNGRLIVREVQT